VAYVLRAIGDVGSGALSWLSPIGWSQAMHAYAGESWWPALLPIAATAVLGWGAVRLFERRDIGSGVLPARPGPARGGALMSSPYGLAWRLQRGSVVGWSVGMFVMGLAYGSIGDSVGDLIGDSGYSQDIFGQGGGSLVDSFYATAALMLALIGGSAFAISSVLRLRGEELGGRAEALLATAVSRARWGASHLLIAAVGTVVVVAVGGLGMGLGFALVTGDSSAILRLTGATAQYIAPVLLLAALTWLGYGARSSWGFVGWLALGFCAVVMLLGETLSFPSWLMSVSPFHHLALVPAEGFRLAPLLALVAIAGAGGVLGLFALRRRDLA
jgi:ABC-2 type transport system permease protein